MEKINIWDITDSLFLLADAYLINIKKIIKPEERIIVNELIKNMY